ncbi:MAG: pantetheine-phosphate adenylyltransferase [Methanomassiliicoccales archaeon]
MAVGGTFNVLHKGHRALLDKAFAVGDEVVIGIMSDDYVTKNKRFHIPLNIRISAVRDYVASKGKPYSINIIDDPTGNLLSDPDLIGLVVSPERWIEASDYSSRRKALGLPELQLYRIGYVLADDCTPISSSRILQGEIDTEGKMLRPIRVSVSSENPAKLKAVQNVMSRLYRNVEVKGVRISTRLSSEPWGDDVERLTIEYARKCIGTADYGIGLEDGLFKRNSDVFKVQFCAIVDRMNRITIGHGSGFKYPPLIGELISKGLSVSQAFHESFGLEKSYFDVEEVNFLTNGMLQQTEINEQAILAAMIPRIRKELYFEL